MSGTSLPDSAGSGSTPDRPGNARMRWWRRAWHYLTDGWNEWSSDDD